MAFITSVSPNKKYFRDSNGDPAFFYMECAWFIAKVNPNDWPQYFASRKAWGFSVIEMAASAGNTETDTYTDSSGVSHVWYDAGQPGGMSAGWVTQLKAFITMAATYDLNVLWSIAGSEMIGQTAQSCFDYGVFMGNIASSHPNIIFGLGVDYNANEWSAGNPLLRQVQLGVKSVSPNHLWSIHNYDGSISSDNTYWSTFIDFEMAYSYPVTYDLVARGYTSGIGPVHLVESEFEKENNEGGPDTNYETMARQALWTATRGGSGFDYGHRDIWRADTVWKSALSSALVETKSWAAAKVRTSKWWKHVPDLNNTFLLTGQGTKPATGTMTGSRVDPLESTYATATVSPDGDSALIFMPAGRQITIDTSKIGANASIVWHSVEISTPADTGTPGTFGATMTPPDGTGWLGVISADAFAAAGDTTYAIGSTVASKVFLGSNLVWTNSTPPEPAGPLAIHWDFNDASPTTSTDLVAGKVMSLNTMAKVASRNGTGLQSSSTTGMATVSEGLVNPSEFTITAWIYTTGQYAGLRFKSGGQAGTSKIEMYGRYQISGSRMYLQTYQRAMVNGAWVLGYMNTNIKSATVIEPAWNFFTLTFDSSTIRAWMNGVSRQSATATGPIDAVDFFEVMSLTSAANDAIVDDVRIYNKVLTEAEILAAMAE